MQLDSNRDSSRFWINPQTNQLLARWVVDYEHVLRDDVAGPRFTVGIIVRDSAGLDFHTITVEYTNVIEPPVFIQPTMGAAIANVNANGEFPWGVPPARIHITGSEITVDTGLQAIKVDADAVSLSAEVVSGDPLVLMDAVVDVLGRIQLQTSSSMQLGHEYSFAVEIRSIQANGSVLAAQPIKAMVIFSVPCPAGEVISAD